MDDSEDTAQRIYETRNGIYSIRTPILQLKIKICVLIFFENLLGAMWVIFSANEKKKKQSEKNKAQS